MCDRLGDGLGFIECAQSDLTGESFGSGFFQYLECVECLVPCYVIDPSHAVAIAYEGHQG